MIDQFYYFKQLALVNWRFYMSEETRKTGDIHKKEVKQLTSQNKRKEMSIQLFMQYNTQ